MDLSVDYSDLFNDDALIKVVNELDGLFREEDKTTKPEESKNQSKESDFKSQTFSINSTRYDSETSSASLIDESFNKYSSQLRSYQKRFDLHISKSLNPLVRYVLESSITIGYKQVNFTKKKEYVEHLIDETVKLYKEQWKQVYLPLCFGSENEATDGSYDTSLYEEVSKQYNEVCKELGSVDLKGVDKVSSSRSSYETHIENSQEDIINDVFVEIGYRHILLESLYENGIEYFYYLMEFLLVLIEKTNYNYKVVQSLDLISTLIKVMPELSILMFVPKNKDSKIMFEKKCYFKLLVKKIHMKLGLTNDSLLQIYKNCLKGTFVPFYMANPYKNNSSEVLDGADNEPNELISVYVLDRIFNLVLMLTENILQFLHLKLSETLKTNLIKKMKKYLLIPFFGIRSLHELFLPFSGEFTFEEVRKVDYLSLIKKYMYPPPPLYTLRLRFLEILNLFLSADLVKYSGNFLKANRRMIESDSVSGMNQKVDKVLVNYFHMFSFGASFMLMGEFMKRSVENAGSFFGNYLFLLPHFSLNYSQINETLVIEENVYRLQKGVVNLLCSLNESKLFTNENFMNIKSLNMNQNNNLKRLLSLLVHYAVNTTESEIEDAEHDFNLDNEFNIRNMFNIDCNESCESVQPYDIYSISRYLLNVNFGVDQDDLFIYNNYPELKTHNVDVCNFEEYNKVCKMGLDPERLYIPLDNRKDVQYCFESIPYIKFKAKTTRAHRFSPDELDFLEKLNKNNELKLKRLDTDFSTSRTLEDCLDLQDAATGRFRNSGMEIKEKCGLSCLIHKHMVQEPRFKHVFDLRKELVVLFLKILSSYPTSRLGELEPIYHSFLKKLLF